MTTVPPAFILSGDLPGQGLAVRRITVTVASQNPFMVKGPDGILIPGTRLTLQKLQKNEKEELPVQGKREHEDMSSRKQKKMNKSSKRKKKQP